MKILHLTLKKKWFDQIASGKKKIEYREYKPYWSVRLRHFSDTPFSVWKEFDEIHFRNGYRKDSPFMRVECIGISAEHIRGHFYCIYLGKVLEVRNEKKI